MAKSSFFKASEILIGSVQAHIFGNLIHNARSNGRNGRPLAKIIRTQPLWVQL
jgi:hypothetical protein